MKLYPYERGAGGGNSFSHAEGGGGAEKMFPQKLELSAILKGEA